MSNQIGGIVVEIAANVARFSSDMGRVAQIATDRAAQIDKALGIVSTGLKSLGAGFVVGLTLDKIKGKIEAAISSAAGLQQLSERTGAAVETLSGLAAVARLSNTDTDALATGLQKLSKSMVDAEAGGKKTTAAFNAIGINVKELEGQGPDQVFLKIAKQLDKYQDGAEKTALAQQLLGKAGANLLPVMKDVVAVGDLQIKVTAEQARVADEYEKNLKRLDAAQGAIFKRIGLELVPVLNEFTKAMLEQLTATAGVKSAVDDLAKDGSIRDWAEDAARAVAFVVDAFDGVMRAVQIAGRLIGGTGVLLREFWNSDPKKLRETFRALSTEAIADVDKIMQKSLFSDRLDKRLAEARAKPTGATPETEKKRITGLHGDETDKDAAAQLRALLEERLKLQERYIQKEQALYQQRELYLQRLYDEDLLSIGGYFDSRQRASEDHLAAVLGAYDKEIAALQRYAIEAGKGSERIRAQTQIQEVQIKRTEALNAQGAKSEQLAYDQAKAQRAYADSIENLNIKLLQLQGNLEEAAKRQAVLSNRQIRQRLTVEGNTAGLATLDEIERQEALRARLNEMNERAGVIAERQATAEGRAQLAFNRGTIGEFESLRKVGEARAKSIEQLEAIATEMERVAAATGDPRLLANAEAFRLKLDELRASSDALANKFNDMFEKSFASAFGDFINGTKSASQAFKSFANDVVQQINRMVAESLAKQLFGAGGSGSGAGGFFAGLFGGGGGTAGNNPSAYTGGGGGFGDAVGSFFSSIFGGGRASGGPVSAGMMYEINERRMPEVASLGGRDYLLTGGQGGRVSPAQAGGGPLIGQIVFQGPMPTDRRAQTQFLAELGQTVSRASGRNG